MLSSLLFCLCVLSFIHHMAAECETVEGVVISKRKSERENECGRYDYWIVYHREGFYDQEEIVSAEKYYNTEMGDTDIVSMCPKNK